MGTAPPHAPAAAPSRQAAAPRRRWLALLTGVDPVRRALYVVGAAPGVWAFYRGLTDQLGADPVATLEHLLGLWALRFLLLSLAVTPLRRMGGPSLIRYRRAIGLLAFYYALAHLAVYLTFDRQLDVASIWGDIVKRPYITVGMLSLAILVPLAVTSNGTMIRKLGAAAWQKLHRWVYLAAILAVAHFLLLVKTWPGEPLVYAGILALLLGFRVFVMVRKRLSPQAPRRARSPTGQAR